MTSGSERRQRKFRLTIRFSEDEQAALDEAAEKAGLTLSSYVRGALLGAKAPRAARKPPVEKGLLANSLGHLGKIGSNLNQIAHVLNAGRGSVAASPALEAELGRVFRELGEARLALLEALGRKVHSP